MYIRDRDILRQRTKVIHQQQCVVENIINYNILSGSEFGIFVVNNIS